MVSNSISSQGSKHIPGSTLEKSHMIHAVKISLFKNSNFIIMVICRRNNTNTVFEKKKEIFNPFSMEQQLKCHEKKEYQSDSDVIWNVLPNLR